MCARDEIRGSRTLIAAFLSLPACKASCNSAGNSPPQSYLSPCFLNSTHPSVALIAISCTFPYVFLRKKLVFDIRLWSFLSRLLGRFAQWYSFNSHTSAKKLPALGPKVTLTFGMRPFLALVLFSTASSCKYSISAWLLRRALTWPSLLRVCH